VVQDGDLIRLYCTFWGNGPALGLEYAESRDGIHFTKPDLDIVPWKDVPKTNIIMPNAVCPESLKDYFFGTCVFIDTNPACKPDERYKMITGDTPTWVFASPDGLHFRPLFDKPSFRAADTNNICMFDNRLGRYVAYMRGFSNGRAVVRCEFDDLADFGPEQLVFAPDARDQASIDRNRFVAMDFYNSSAIKYPYAENAYFMYPSAYFHFPEPPVGERGNDGVVDIQFASSHDGITWTRLTREPFIALKDDEQQLYMASGIVRQEDTLYLYYGVYYKTHGAGPDPEGYVTRASLRLDGFVSVDAGDEDGRLTTVPMTFAGKHLELNVQGEDVRVGILDEEGRAVQGFGLSDCDAVSGDHIARTVTWNGESDVSRLAGKTIRLVFRMTNAKLYAFQFVR
jgi:hypothetical protein